MVRASVVLGHIHRLHLITGEPFQFRYWLTQCAVYLLVMLVEKIIVGPLILFNFWNKVSLAVSRVNVYYWYMVLCY